VAHSGKGAMRRCGTHAAGVGLCDEGYAAAGQSMQCAGEGAGKQAGSLARKTRGWALVAWAVHG
jgi:hypothetical protein